MKPIYRINEIFVTLQGEGHFTGTPSLFIRFSGCNLKCPFCDTQHSSYREMSADEIIAQACQTSVSHVVLTGGEPSLQVDEVLLSALHNAKKFIAIETNGTTPLLPGIDWVTLSPKKEWSSRPLALTQCDELKVVFTGMKQDLHAYDSISCHLRYLQPCDVHDEVQNRRILREAVSYCLEHPQWRLSLQTHKLIGIP